MNLPVEAPAPLAVDDSGSVRREAFGVPDPGTYWTAVREIALGRGESLPEGASLLVTDVSFVEGGEFHSVELRPSPEWLDGLKDRWRGRLREYRLNLTAYQFAIDCRPAPPDAERIRADELRRLLHVELLTPELPAMDAPALPGPGAAERLDASKALRETVGKSIEAAMGNHSKALARVADASEIMLGEMQAKADAMIAGPKRVMDDMRKTIDALSAYAGEGCEVEELWSGGESAAADEPIHVFQAMRFMDEEYHVHLADGGADWQDWPAFVRHLKESPGAVDDLIPAPRGMCVMRFRREGKEYRPGATMSDVLANWMENAPNHVGFILYRDGGRCWTIQSSVTEHDIPKLFPSRDDFERLFRRKMGDGVEDWIRFGDLRYKDSWDAAEKVEWSYLRLVLTLWGVHERLGLFSNLPANAQLPRLVGDSTLFKWVRDDDSALLGDSRVGLDEWLDDNQARLESGVRVYCDWRVLVDDKTAPSLASGRSGRVVDGPIHVVRRVGRDFVVKVDAEVHSWAAWTSDSPRRRFKASVNLSKWIERRDDGLHKKRGLGFIVLDGVTAAEVGLYVKSRIERRRYLDYIGQFIGVRDHLIAEERKQADVRDAVIRRMPTVADGALTTAIALWRKARRGRQVPSAGENGFDGTVEFLLGTLRRMSQEAPRCLIEMDGVFAVTLSGRGRHVTYQPEIGPAEPLQPARYAVRREWTVGDGLASSRHTPRVVEWAPKSPGETLLWTDAGVAETFGPLEGQLKPHERDKLLSLLNDPDVDPVFMGERDHYGHELRSLGDGGHLLKPLATRWLVNRRMIAVLLFRADLHPWMWQYGQGDDRRYAGLHYRRNWLESAKPDYAVMDALTYLNLSRPAPEPCMVRGWLECMASGKTPEAAWGRLSPWSGEHDPKYELFHGDMDALCAKFGGHLLGRGAD